MKTSSWKCLKAGFSVAALASVSLGIVWADETTPAPWSESEISLGQVPGIPKGKLNQIELEKLVRTGEKLFSAKFSLLDGAGRPNATQAIIPTKARRSSKNNFSRTSGPDSSACASCHNDPFVGGAGDFVTSVFVSEGFSNADFDSTDPQFSNERGTNHLFGAGLIELLAREMSRDLGLIRSRALTAARNTNANVRVELTTKGVSFGFLNASADGLVNLSEVDGVDQDLVVRPFSQKGVMTSLRQFTINAMNHHHGMQAAERFGIRWTGTHDYDEDTYDNELTPGDISALVAWQATLDPPREIIPKGDLWRSAARKGRALFSEFNCTSCHRTTLPLESLEFEDPGMLDVAGTLNSSQVEEPAIYDLSLRSWAATLQKDEYGRYLVPLFGDLKRHKMTDQENEALGNELLSQRFVDRTIFLSAELWGVASTAPYGHRNDYTTLDGIIRAHGGAARASTDAYMSADLDQRDAVIAFLKTLVIEQ